MTTGKKYPLRHPLRRTKYSINGVVYQKYKSKKGKGDMGLVQACYRTLDNIRISTTFTLRDYGFKEAIRLATIFVLKGRIESYREAISLCKEEITKLRSKRDD